MEVALQGKKAYEVAADHRHGTYYDYKQDRQPGGEGRH